MIIATTREDAERVCKAVAWLGNEEIAISGDAFIYRHTLNPKYVAYIFQTGRFLEHKIQYSTGAKVVRMSADNMARWSPCRVQSPSAAFIAFYFSRIDIFYTFVEK